MQTITLPAGRQSNANAVRFFERLPTGTAWRVVVEPWKPKRSESQNNYLWGVVYPTLMNSGVEEFSGLTPNELHQVLLEAHFGSKTVKTISGTRTFPNRTSSRLNKQEFSEYVEFIQRTAAHLAIYIPDPEVT